MPRHCVVSELLSPSCRLRVATSNVSDGFLSEVLQSVPHMDVCPCWSAVRCLEQGR